MPTTVVLPDMLVKKMQKAAVPLQDTHLTVIDRAVDALLEKMFGSNIPTMPQEAFAAAAPTPTGDSTLSYPIETPPSLTFTKPSSILLAGDFLPKNELYWNLLLFRAISVAAKKMDKQALRQAILINKMEGKHEDSGFRYIPEAQLSVQGADANTVWKAIVHLIKSAGLTLDVTFRWENKEGAANPGQVANMRYLPA